MRHSVGILTSAQAADVNAMNKTLARRCTFAIEGLFQPFTNGTWERVLSEERLMPSNDGRGTSSWQCTEAESPLQEQSCNQGKRLNSRSGKPLQCAGQVVPALSLSIGRRSIVA